MRTLLLAAAAALALSSGALAATNGGQGSSGSGGNAGVTTPHGTVNGMPNHVVNSLPQAVPNNGIAANVPPAPGSQYAGQAPAAGHVTHNASPTAPSNSGTSSR